MRKILIFIALFIEINIVSQPYKILPNTFFSEGETLKFQIRYGFIIGGDVQLLVDKLIIENKNLIHVKGTAVTIGIADKLFRVNDIYESYFDKETSLPVLAIQNVKEGRTYKYFNEVRFNRQNNTLISTKSGEHKANENILDMMSVFYYIRRLDYSNIKEGDTFKFLTYFSDNEFPLEMRYRGKELLETKWGKINCLKFAPIVEPGRVFKSKDDMLIWYTDDANRIPVQVTMEMLIGHVTVELIGFSGLKNSIIFEKLKQ